jgi:hypothetical protein
MIRIPFLRHLLERLRLFGAMLERTWPPILLDPCTLGKTRGECSSFRRPPLQIAYIRMGELYDNVTPFFTQWVIRTGYLHEPFVVIDVGVQGGPHPRWEYLL